MMGGGAKDVRHWKGHAGAACERDLFEGRKECRQPREGAYQLMV